MNFRYAMIYFAARPIRYIHTLNGCMTLSWRADRRPFHLDLRFGFRLT